MQVEMFELFAGQAKVSQVFRQNHVATTSYDILYDPRGRCMNFLKEGGYALETKLLDAAGMSSHLRLLIF